MTRFWLHVVRTGQEVERTSYVVITGQGKCYSARFKFNIKVLNLEIHLKDTERFSLFITTNTLQLFNQEQLFNLSCRGQKEAHFVPCG
jgi:hypothetical protein